MKNVFMFENGGFKLVAKPIVFEISDVLNTPRGGNFGDPEYGSNRFELIDKPLDGLFKMRAFKETAEVIMKYFPQLKLEKMELIDLTPTPLHNGDGRKALVRCLFKNGERMDV